MRTIVAFDRLRFALALARAGITKVDLARQVKLSRAALMAIAGGFVPHPRRQDAIAAALGVPVAFLWRPLEVVDELIEQVA